MEVYFDVIRLKMIESEMGLRGTKFLNRHGPYYDTHAHAPGKNKKFQISIFSLFGVESWIQR
jgi:hypothetical protein